ncbi:MAG: hypothetical protein D6735_07175 [Acidobacteria bacterium]|jgi:hypothetical protein|nr:MAG: hypothetical protein D6735_07175 [Acidobacteriota bacterium]
MSAALQQEDVQAVRKSLLKGVDKALKVIGILDLEFQQEALAADWSDHTIPVKVKIEDVLESAG